MNRRTFLRGSVAAGLLSAGCSVRGTSAGAADASALAMGQGLDGKPIKLCYNENPLGLCEAARQAVIDGIPQANRYPVQSQTVVIDALAAKHEVSASNIVLGNGSTEVLQMAVQVFGQPGTRFVQADPTYEDVAQYADPYGLDILPVPLRSDYSHDIDQMRQVAEEAHGDVVVYVCNPNNPTATLTSSDELDDWIRTAPRSVCFLVDEAYFEYAEGTDGYHSALPWIDTHPNVVVFRTFSKVYGMAGMRLGYGIAHEETADSLRKLQSVMNANQLALFAGLASLQDPNYVDESVAMNARSRRILHNVLDDLGLEYLPSHTNFVMHRIRANLSEYSSRMAEAGFLVGRPFPPMLGYNRLSLGSPDQMEQFAQTLREFRSKGWV